MEGVKNEQYYIGHISTMLKMVDSLTKDLVAKQFKKQIDRMDIISLAMI